VTDLDAISSSSTGSVHHISYLAKDSTWREVMTLSDDGRYLASTGFGRPNRKFLEVIDLAERKQIVDWRWKDEGPALSDLAFSENSDRFLAIAPDGSVRIISLAISSGAPVGGILLDFNLHELIGARSCTARSSILHAGGKFAVVVRARMGELALENHPVLVLWEDRNGGLIQSDVHTVILPPEFAEAQTARRSVGGKPSHEFKILPSVDRSTLAVVGNSTILVDLEKCAIVGDFPTQNVVGFSPDGKRLLALHWGGQLEVWDVATGRQLPALHIMRRSVDFLRTLTTRFRLEEDETCLYRFDSATATFYVLKYDEARDPIPKQDPRQRADLMEVKSYFVLGRLSLQVP
jgi:WD40 repeat protein